MTMLASTMAATLYRPVPGYDDLYAGIDASIVHGNEGMLEPKLRGRYITVRVPGVGIRNVHLLMTAAYLGTKPATMHTRHGVNGCLDNTPPNLCYGTNGDNQRDSVEAGTHRNTSKVKCPKGHHYTQQNTYVTPAGNRQCRTCRYISNQNGVAPKVKGRHISPEEIQKIKKLGFRGELSNRTIANIIGVSPQTVARHRKVAT